MLSLVVNCIVAENFVTNVTYHDFARTYHGLISSYVTLLTHFCVRGTVPASTHCTASTMVNRKLIGCHISFP